MLKAKDIYLIMVVVVIASVAAFIGSSALIKTSKLSSQVEVVEPINDDFQEPSKAYFNSNSLNPTQTITIGDGNPTPFQQSQ